MATEKNMSKVPGAKARANALSPEQRSEIAAKAAIARWGEKPPVASHTGNFKAEFGVDVECYVLADKTKTTVISQTGLARILGLSPRGNSFPSFINSQTMADYVGGDLREKVENPVRFQWAAPGGGTPPITVNGFNSAMLIDVCNAVILAEAKGALKGPRYKTIVQQAHIIVGASAKDGIRQLVYALAGYSPSAEEVIAAFKLYIQEEARKYEPEFPNELYMQWHRLYEIPVPIRGKPWHFKFLTVNHIYHPLAQSGGKVYELLKALKAKDGDRAKKLFQFLNTVGARALRMHLGRVLEMAESASNKAEYEAKVRQRFGDQKELELVFPTSPTASPPPALQSPPVVPES